MILTDKNEAVKPGFNAPADRDPVRDMLAEITMDGDVEVAKWFHKGTHVFTVRTLPNGKLDYRAAA